MCLRLKCLTSRDHGVGMTQVKTITSRNDSRRGGHSDSDSGPVKFCEMNIETGHIRKTMAAMVAPKARRVPLARKPANDRLAAALAASLILHALILSLQFGVSGLGLSVSGMSRTERRASIPTLQAILREPRESSLAEVKPQPPVLADQTIATIRVLPRKPGESQIKGQAARPPVPGGVPKPSTAVVTSTSAQPEIKEKLNLAAEKPDQLPASPNEKGAAILATDKESSWSASVAAASQESEEKARSERIELEKASEAATLERARLEQAENQRKAELAAIARAAAEAAERQRIEEGNRAAEQAALAKARLETVERARIEEEKRRTEQAALNRADASAKRAQAEAVEQARQLAAQSEPAGEAKKPQDGSGSASGAAGRAEVARPQPDTGGSLASRALDQARSGLQGVPARQPAPIEGPRRGSILGRDPKDIQLAFYGEGWRQKVERIGSLNFPQISKTRHYDPLVVTVSINSDGTLAGVRIVRSSGVKEIDEAVRRIVEMSAPFAAFPPDLRRSYDVVDITRTWNFLEERPRIYSQ